MLDKIYMCVGSLNIPLHIVSAQQISTVVCYLELGRTGVKPQPCHSLPVRPWTNHLISLSSSFLSHVMRLIVLTSQDS